MNPIKSRRDAIYRLCHGAIFLALAIVLPHFLPADPAVRTLFSLMHIPVMLAGIVCGPAVGASVGLAAPLLSFVFFGKPMGDMAMAMSLELAAYALLSGAIFAIVPKIYKENAHVDVFVRCGVAMLPAMVIGRIIFGLIMATIHLNKDAAYSFEAFINAVLLKSWLGIILQIVLVPALVWALYQAKLLPNHERFRTYSKKQNDEGSAPKA